MRRYVVLALLILTCWSGQGHADVTVAMGGDVAMSWRRIPVYWKKFPWKKNPFRYISDVFKSADLSIVNMEGVLMKRDPHYAIPRWNLWAPAVSAKAFKPGGITAVSHANNHTFDGKAAGVLETIRHLNRAGIDVFGSGRTKAAAEKPYIFKKGGECIAVIPATTKMNMWIGGRAHVAIYGKKRRHLLLGRVSAEKKTCAFVIVYIHWGKQYRPRPGKWQVKFAHQLVDAGASMVVGHHSHVLGSMEFYKDAFIAYSLGNLVFSNHWPKTRRTGVLEVSIAANRIKSVRFRPMYIHHRGFVPKPMTLKQRQGLIKRLRKASKGFRTQIDMKDDHFHLQAMTE